MVNCPSSGRRATPPSTKLEVRTVTSMPDNALENFAPCPEAISATYWAANVSVDPCWSDPSAEPYLSIPVNFGPGSPSLPTPPSAVVGSVLPLRRAEQLIATLPGVLSVRIVPSETGAIDEIHVLTTSEIAPKNTVRNIESALMAQLGLRVNHRKVSIAQSLDPARAADQPDAPPTAAAPRLSHPAAVPGVASSSYVPYHAPTPSVAAPATDVEVPREPEPSVRPEKSEEIASAFTQRADTRIGGRRVLIFDDVEVRRSRSRGVLCRVTLSRDGQEFVGEWEGQESERSRIELAARATLLAILESLKATPGGNRNLALEGSKLIEAFDREFVFVSVLGRVGREPAVLTGSCEVKESPETSAVLAVLDATNRWIQLER